MGSRRVRLRQTRRVRGVQEFQGARLLEILDGSGVGHVGVSSFDRRGGDTTPEVGLQVVLDSSLTPGSDTRIWPRRFEHSTLV